MDEEHESAAFEHVWTSTPSRHGASGGRYGVSPRARGAANASAAGIGVAGTTVTSLGGGGMAAMLGPAAVGGLSGAAAVTGPAGMVLQAGLSGVALRRGYRTHQHIKGLEALQARGRTAFPCDAAQSPLHGFIFDKVLPFIIQKKKFKRVRSGVQAVPAVGMVATIRKFQRHISKSYSGTLHVKRSFYAQALAHHLVTCNCALSDAIVAELLGSEEHKDYVRALDSGEVAVILKDKMNSW